MNVLDMRIMKEYGERHEAYSDKQQTHIGVTSLGTTSSASSRIVRPHPIH